jgi:hypothetical protein
MTIVLLITKEDISTHQMGLHYQIKTQNGIELNFTKEAIEELYEDMRAIDLMKLQEQS